VSKAVPETAELIAQLDRDHHAGENRVRELTHLLMAWEYLVNARRASFEAAVKAYVRFYLEYMRQEEVVILPTVERALTDADWHALNAAFATKQDPLNTRLSRTPQFDRLLTCIVMLAPSPGGVNS
jgi:hemerythrin-like domain-containing protein